MAERKPHKKPAELAPRRLAKLVDAEARERKEKVEAERAPQEGRKWWFVTLAVGIVLAAATTLVAHKHRLAGVNLSLFRHVNDWPDSLRAFFLAATIAPNSLLIGASAVVVSFVLKLYQLSWQLAAAIVGAGGAAFVLKRVIAEPRPYAMVQGVHMRAHEADPGFPSGHVTIMTAVVLTLWPYLPRGWRWLVALAIPLVALSRMYLGVHSPLDVVGGFGVGLSVVSIMRVLPEPLRRLLRLD